MPTICELKVMLKKMGFKGYTNLKKVQLEKLLETGTPSSSASSSKTPKDKKPRKPRVAKPKPFVPAEVKGDTPVVAENPIPKTIYPNGPPALKLGKKSAMQSFFGGLSLVQRQLPNPAKLPAPNMMLNMAKLLEGRVTQDAPFATPRKDKPTSMRGVKQYV